MISKLAIHQCDNFCSNWIGNNCRPWRNGFLRAPAAAVVGIIIPAAALRVTLVIKQ